MPGKPRPIRNAFEAFMPDQLPGHELENARLLPLACLVPNPHQARQAFDEAALRELQASIEAHGVLEPILVRPQGEQYQILAGERRFRAARAAGLREIPALILDLDDTQAAYVTAVENLQRADLDLEDEARQFAFLLQLTGLSQRALAAHLGITHDYIARRIALLPHPHLLAGIRSGACTQQAALRLLAQPALLAEVEAGALTLDAALAHMAPGGTAPGAADRDGLALSAAEAQRTRLAPEPLPFRWRWVEEIDRGMRKFDRVRPQEMPREERAALRQRLQSIQARLEQAIAQCDRADGAGPA